jgi:hypothetical protein
MRRIVPSARDIGDAMRMMRFNLGLAKAPPRRHSSHFRSCDTGPPMTPVRQVTSLRVILTRGGSAEEAVPVRERGGDRVSLPIPAIAEELKYRRPRRTIRTSQPVKRGPNAATRSGAWGDEPWGHSARARERQSIARAYYALVTRLSPRCRPAPRPLCANRCASTPSPEPSAPHASMRRA